MFQYLSLLMDSNAWMWQDCSNCYTAWLRWNSLTNTHIKLMQFLFTTKPFLRFFVASRALLCSRHRRADLWAEQSRRWEQFDNDYALNIHLYQVTKVTNTPVSNVWEECFVLFLKYYFNTSSLLVIDLLPVLLIGQNGPRLLSPSERLTWN